MSILDLLFMLAVLVTVVGALRIVYLLARRHRDHARRSARRLVFFLAVYGVALVATSLLEPRHVVALGEERCFDEWCIVVDSARMMPSIGSERADGAFVVVSARILNHGRGRRQRESDVYGAIVDSSGARHPGSRRGKSALAQATNDTASLRDYVEAGASRTVRLVFDVPANPGPLEFLTLHDRFPHVVIIGDPESLLHRPTVVPLNARPTY